MKIALGLPGISVDAIERVEFYRTDLEILGGLGDVSVVGNASETVGDTEVLFTWWWSRSLALLTSAWAKGIPGVVTGATDIGNPVGLRAPEALAKNIAARVAAQVAVGNLAISNAEAERLSSWRYPNVATVPLAVDTKFLRPSRNNFKQRERHMLLTVLHLNPKSIQRKGLLRAIDGLALAEDQEMYLVVVGADQGGKYAAVDYAEERGVGDRVRFAGPLNRNEKRKLLWRASAYLQLSTYEGFGVAVVEAMAAHCPVVVSTSGSLPEVTGGLALAYASSTDEVADAIDQLGVHPGAAREIASCAAQRVFEYYSYSVRADALRQILTSAAR